MPYYPSSSVPTKKTNLGSANYINIHSQSMQTPFLSDSFIAQSTSVFVNIELAGGMWGNATCPIDFFIGGANQTPPFYTFQGGVVSGATLYELGSLSALPISGKAPLTRRILVASLTPGATYYWQLTCNITGGSATSNNPSRPDTAGITNGSSVVTDTSILLSDEGMAVFSSTTGIPSPAYVKRVQQGVGFLLSSTQSFYTPLAATATNAAIAINVGWFNNVQSIALRTGISGKQDKGYILNNGFGANAPQIVPFTLGGRSEVARTPIGDNYGRWINVGSVFGPAISSTNLNSPSDCSFTPDGTKFVAAGSNSGVVHVVNPETDAIASTFTIPALTVTAMTNVGTTVTATISSTTNWVANQAVTIASAAGMTNVNGTWTIASIVNGTQFTFVVTSTPTGTYTASSATAYQATFPCSVACDNTYAYFGDTFETQVTRMNLSTGVCYGLVLAGVPRIASIALTPDLTKLIVGLQNGQIAIVNTSNWTAGGVTAVSLVGVGGGGGAIGSSTIIAGVACSDNNTVWCTAQTSTVGSFVRVNLSSLAKTAYGLSYPGNLALDYDAPQTLTASGTNSSPVIACTGITEANHYQYVTGTGIPVGSYVGTVTVGVGFRLSSSEGSQIDANYTGTTGTISGGIALSGAGNGWTAYTSGTALTSNVTTRGPYMGSTYNDVSSGLGGSPTAPAAAKVAITNDGQIYFALSTSNEVWEYPGGTFAIATNPGFNNDFCEVIIEGGL